VLRTQRPPLSELAIIGEEEVLERAIALVEAKFGGTDATLPRRSVVTRAQAAATHQANERFATADAAQTEALIFRPDNLAKIVPANARAEKSGTWLWHAPIVALATRTRRRHCDA
jgi:hypothetical protein